MWRRHGMTIRVHLERTVSIVAKMAEKLRHSKLITVHEEEAGTGLVSFIPGEKPGCALRTNVPGVI